MATQFQVLTIPISNSDSNFAVADFDNSVNAAQAAIHSFDLEIDSGGEREVAIQKVGIESVTLNGSTEVDVMAFMEMSNGGHQYTVSGTIRVLVIADVRG